jgi:acetyl-CoA acetyltransferase
VLASHKCPSCWLVLLLSVGVAKAAMDAPDTPHHLHSLHTCTRALPWPGSAGLWDPYRDIHMGECAEICARHFGISREQQDQHAIISHQRAQAATAAGTFLREIVPVEVAGPRGRPPVVVSTDEGPSKMDADKLKRLKPHFAKVWRPASLHVCTSLMH